MKKKHLSEKAGFKNIIFSLATAIIFLLLISRSQAAIDYMRKGLELCAKNVVPSLFPLMVVSALAADAFRAAPMPNILSAPSRAIFGVGAESAVALILGALCGFPVGTRLLCDAYDGGRITKKELERALCFCNNPGAGFVISAVGVALFGNVYVGIALFCCVMLSALLSGAAQRVIFGSVSEKPAPMSALPHTVAKKVSFTLSFTSAVRSSALSMLSVCAFVVFFSAIVGCIGAIFKDFGASDAAMSPIFCIFELSSGVGAAAELSPTLAVILTAAALSWSGLSVHFQIMTVAADRNIAFAPYFISKALQSLLSAAISAIALHFFDFPKEAFENLEPSRRTASPTVGLLISAAIMFVSILTIFISNMRAKQCKKSKRKFF